MKRQQPIDISKMIRFYYGLENYIIPENLKVKTFIFYSSDEEKAILEKNKIFCLTNDCSQSEVIDTFENKVKTDSLIAIHTEDIRLMPLLEEMKVPSLLIFKNPTKDIFKTLNMNFSSSYYQMSEKELEVLHQMFIEQLIKVGAIAVGPLITIVKINDDFDFSEENIHNIITTKYNIENIFNDDFEKISSIVMNHARS